MVRSYGFWGTFFKNVIVPVSLGVVAFFVYRTIDGRIVVLERDVKSLDLLGKYKNLEMKLESNILYNGNITSQLNKNITDIRKDVVSIFEKLNQLKSSIVTLDCLEEKINELKSSFVTLDYLEERLSELKSSNKTFEKPKLHTNSGEVICDEDYEDKKDVSSAATPVSDGTGENSGSENQECNDNKEDDEKKTNIVAEAKSKPESDDEDDSDVDNSQYEDLDEGLEEYDAYNDDIFFNDTDSRQKDIITQQHEQIDNKGAGNYNNRNDYNRDKEVVDLIQSLEQTKRRVDDLERIVSKYETGYSLFKLQGCFGPSLTWLGERIDFKPFKELQKKDDTIKFPCSFFLNSPFSRILPMISYHCLFYVNDNKKEDQQQEENNIINSKINLKEDNVIKKGNGENPLRTFETSPTMFCVSLFRIIKKSLFFLDFGLKICYPSDASDKTAMMIVKNFWDAFINQLFTRNPWCIFLGFNLGPQLLFFFSFSYYDWSCYKKESQKSLNKKGKILLKKIFDNFKIELRLLEVSI